jgi:hypothetical protein
LTIRPAYQYSTIPKFYQVTFSISVLLICLFVSLQQLRSIDWPK